jgi:UDP-GlcNAc:undecaprenyl-phosphate GlcNAc-1-phosphate transferase
VFPYAIAFATAAIIAFAGTWLFDIRLRGRSLAESFTNPDREGDRPYTGGVVVFVALCAAPFLATLVSTDVERSMQALGDDLVAFFGAMALVFVLGVYDDLRVLDFKVKLAGQVAAAIIVVVAGFRMDSIGLPWDNHVEVGAAGSVLAVLWIVGVTNAVNLIDGKDGVAAGVTALAGATITAVAAKANLWFVGVTTAALTASALGFLPHNFPPARKFLGDSGAMLLGFGLAALSLKAAATVDNTVYLSIPIVALGFPLVDTALAIVRRAIDHRHPLKGDADHIHHRLEERVGLGPRGILMLLYALAALFSGGALLIRFVEGPMTQGLVFGAFVLVIGVVLARLGYFGSMWDSHHTVRLRRAITGREVLPAGGNGNGAGDGYDPGEGAFEKGEEAYEPTFSGARRRG